jgi:hypothetical protein
MTEQKAGMFWCGRFPSQLMQTGRKVGNVVICCVPFPKIFSRFTTGCGVNTESYLVQFGWQDNGFLGNWRSGKAQLLLTLIKAEVVCLLTEHTHTTRFTSNTSRSPNCAVCTIFSYEVTIYERGLLDMRIRPFSYPYPPPLSYLLPDPELFLWRTQDHYRAGFRPVNFPWKFGLAPFLNLVSAPGGVPCHRGLPTRRPRSKP